MSDELAVALVAGLLGGGVAGAIFGGITALAVQGRAFDNDRATRFADPRRDRYADLFAVADRAILRADRSARLPYLVDDGRATAASAARLAAGELAGLGDDPTLTDIAGLVAQIQLLGPSVVGTTAEALATALHDLASVATPLISLNVRLDDPDGLDLAKHYADEVTTQLAICRQARGAFLAAARQDIGSATK